MIALIVGVVYLGICLAWSSGTWSIALPQLGVLFAACVSAVRALGRRATIRFEPVVVIAILLVFWGPVQLLLNIPANRFRAWTETLGWLTVAIVLLIARHMLGSASDLKRFITLNLCAGSVLAVIGVLQHVSAPLKAWWLFTARQPTYGPFLYKNQFAAFLELLVPLAFFRMVTDSRRRFLYGVLLAGLLACVVASDSRAGLIISFAELAFLFFLSARRRLVSGRLLLSLALPLVLLMALFTAIVGWEGMLKRFQEPSPWQARAHLAESTFRMAVDRPLLGYGLGNWRVVYPTYATFDNALFANEAHNDWLQWAAEGGVPFAILFLTLAVLASGRVWSHYWGLGVPAVFIHCLVDYPTRDPAVAAIFFMFTGALIGAPHINERRRKRKPSDKELVGSAARDHGLNGST
jgi:O-antigen ligase